MKKQLAIYLAMCAMAFVCVSCLGNDDEDVVAVDSYAALLQFSVGNMELPLHTVTDEGKDTIIKKTVVGGNYRFVIDDRTMQVYNRDSLPKGCDISRVVSYVSCEGVAYYYDSENDFYDLVNTTDSIDFTSPRKLLIASTDGTYMREYTVTLNVHTVEPELMAWQSLPVAPVDVPLRAIPFNDRMLLFGRNAAGEAVVVSSALAGEPSWSAAQTITGNFDDAAIKSITLFNGVLFLVQADGKLAHSADGIAWEYSSASGAHTANSDGFNMKTLLLASQHDGRMWAVANVDGADCDSIVYTTDGVNFVVTEPLPENFPVHDISAVVYPLATNPQIMRNVVVGYSALQDDVAPTVWSKLSTDDEWMQLQPDGNGEFNCPALSNLTVLHYDGCLYAFGGAGVAANENVEPFASFYVSRDNGLTWTMLDSEYMELPASLLGSTAPYAATTDSKKYMWIVTASATWRGSINRLQFQ